MYRLMLYFLIALLAVAIILSAFGGLRYHPLGIIFSAIFITVVCLVANKFFAWVFSVPTNAESVYITALILALIIDPISMPTDTIFFTIATWASILAMGSKYILAIKKKHIFNPAAIAVLITSLALAQSASWWVGTLYIIPFVLAGGILIVRKILRTDLVLSFLAAASIVALFSQGNIIRFWSSTSLLFFAFVMLTEPLTMPPTKWLRIAYGALVGVLFLSPLRLGSLYLTPELALVLGNVFSYLVSSKEKLRLVLKKKEEAATGIYNFSFTSDRKIDFKPGQYLEWTIRSDKNDSRGNRRYFTIASSPTEEDIMIGVKFYPEPSSFKQKLALLKIGETIMAGGRAGDFTLPDDAKKKLVFIAGGIGVTPFRSMIKYLSDKQERRDIVLLYSTKTEADIAYREIFSEAEKIIGLKTVYVTDELITPELIKREAPDYHERYFYISGPHGMVEAFKKELKKLGVPRRNIVTDFFPGFA
jgi:ferredoxin-NADP reductase